MTCPKCGAKESFQTVKCDCGYQFPLDMRQNESRLAHVEPPAAVKTADRYPALRELAKVYQVLAALTLMVGFVRVLNDLRTLFDTDASAGAKVAMTPFVVATEALLTGFAVVTCIAIAEAIKLLFELNDRAAHPAANPGRATS